MANTPYSGLEGTALLIKLKVDGSDIKDNYGIQSIYVNHAINKISSAEVVLIGEVEIDSGDIPITDGDDFSPGKTVEIFAGYSGANQNSIFKGIIVKHTVKLDTESHYTFTIECKHEAVKMTFAGRERYFEKVADDAVIKNIISDYGLSCTVGSCSEENENSIQKMSTDWDFILSRGEFNGFIITLDGDTDITVDAPKLSGAAVLTIEAGTSLMSFEGTLNAEFQPSGVKASAWDYKSLSLIDATASEPVMNSQGNIKPKDLASRLSQKDLHLISPTPMSGSTLKKWADSNLLRKRLSAFKGSLKYFGNAKAKTGTIIEIKGVGKKLSGLAFVTAVSHTIEAATWNTSVNFGMENNRICESSGFSYPAAMGQVPGIQGLQLATVKKIEEDPNHLYRIQLEIPSGSGKPNTTWARMAHFSASNKSGSFFLPETGDEVVLGFLDSDPRFPVILGSLYNGKNASPYNAEATNNTKAFVTRNNLKIEFDEEKKSISFLTPANNSIIISDDGKSIEIKDQNSNSVKLSTEGISIESAKDIKISANGNIEINAKSDLALSGLNVNATADVDFTGKGNATAELSASGQTTVKGAIVMIN
jgi:Rhs element Vgr protein